MPSSVEEIVNHEVETEAWIARYHSIQKSVAGRLGAEIAQSSSAPDSHNDALAFSASLIARAGRLGALQCALDDIKHSNGKVQMEDTVYNLLSATRRQIDLDAATKEGELLERLGPGSAKVQLHDLSRSEQEELLASADVDAFFEEYAECLRPDWDQVIDDSDTEDESTENRSRKQTRSQNHRGRNGFQQAARPAVEMQQQLRTEERPREPLAPVANPYQRTNSTDKRNPPQQLPSTGTNVPPTNSNQFSYTPPSQTGNNSSWGQANTTKGNHNPYRQERPQQPRTTAAVSSNSASSWEEHANRQNPFQTAREMAESIARDDPYQSSRPSNDRHTSEPVRQTPPPPNHVDRPYNQPPQTFNHSEQRQDPSLAAQGSGPSIPNSLRRKFQPPKRAERPANDGSNRPRGPAPSSKGGVQMTRPSNTASKSSKGEEEDELPEELQHLDKELVKKIQNEIMESGDTITFDDIAGLDDAKQTVQEVVCWPMKRPDLFTGLRRAPNGLLLYGPPGTGKTLIGKAIAHESGATFFSISSSSLTSKWIGEGEKLVKTLFAVAAYREPAVVFIDEIDSLLTQRKATENEASRRIKTEFLVQLDGTGTTGQGRVLVIGATNRPQELDEAARRRFTKRLYIPLPTESDRRVLLNVLLKTNNHRLTEADVTRLAKETGGFSGADLKALCTDAAMGPIRQLGPKALEIDVNEVPPISFKHFKRSLKGTRPSVAPSDLTQYEEWDKVYGSKRAGEDDEDDDSVED